MTYLYRTFLKGLFTLLPITLTVYLLFWLALKTENLFAGPLQEIFPSVFSFPGAGLLAGLTLIFLVGFSIDVSLTQQILEWTEEKLKNLPIVRTIYGPIRDVTNLFSRQAGDGQKVVMVQLGDSGPEVLGLVTRDDFSDLPGGTVGAESIAVFIPLSYGMGGFTVIAPKNRVRETQIAAEKAMQLAITAWIKSSR